MFNNIRNTFGPLLLILICPLCVFLLWYINVHLNGSFAAFVELIKTNGFFGVMYHILRPVIFGSPLGFKMIFYFVVAQFILLRFFPGKTYYGPVSPKGNIPVYTANGMPAFLITMFGFVFLTEYLKLFSASIVYDNLGSLLGALNLISLIVCLLLYLKGRFSPSSNDASLSGYFLFDYYWGTELYPRLFSVPLKMFIACRLGMMSWGVLLLSYAAKQQELFHLSNSMIVSIALQFLYLAKFYFWEPGYLSSLDMMHDRAGFYICWGCLVWVPCLYTSPAMYLVLHPIQLPWIAAIGIFVLGASSILINYQADRQRQIVRATQGNCNIWGKKPRTILASFTTANGEIKQNLILASGWWGISRHFHYLPEIMGAFFWSLPALFTYFSPYFYVCFLTILLIDRAFRDDMRCREKYGANWQLYCDWVPYKIIPFIL